MHLARFSHFFGLFLIMLLLFSCVTTTNSTRLYHRELRTFVTDLAVKKKVVYENNQPYLILQAPMTNYTLDLRAYALQDAKTAIWTDVQQIRDAQTFQIHKIKLPITQRQFAIDVRIANNNRKLLYHDIIYTNQREDVAVNLYVTDEQNMPILRNYVKADEGFRIQHNSDSMLKFYVKYYADPIRPAPPPYSQNSGFFNPNKNYHENLFIVPKGKTLKLTKEGLYFIQTDSLSAKGVYLNYFGPDFPEMTRVPDLVLATRYITTNDEYKPMQKAENQKVALDKYWLARNGKAEEAKRLIRLYYNRAEQANKHFTTCKEGWKTDKGLIYLIFGKPAIIRKYPNKDVWYYSHSNNRYPVEFVFLKMSGQFVLERSSNLKEPWNAEVLKWRIGQATE